MTLVPRGTTERQHPARAPWLVGREDGHVDLDLAAPERSGYHVGRDLTRFARPFCPTPLRLGPSFDGSMAHWSGKSRPNGTSTQSVPPTTGYDDAT
jgi:hypothetical protein